MTKTVDLSELKFKPGQECYCLTREDNCPLAMDGKRTEKTSVLSVAFEIFNDSKSEGGLGQAFRGYYVNSIMRNFEHGRYTPPWELWETKKEATAATAWLKAPDFFDDQWMAMLGDRGEFAVFKKRDQLKARLEAEEHPYYRQMSSKTKKVDLEDAQLAICCASISNARDVLWDCFKYGGLIQLRVDELVKYLRGCDPSLSFIDGMEGDDLDMLFKALGVPETAKRLKDKK